MTKRIDLPGGWYLVMCDDPSSAHNECWFLSTPDDGGVPSGVWVAKFWDGPQAGRSDAIAFAASIGVEQF